MIWKEEEFIIDIKHEIKINTINIQSVEFMLETIQEKHKEAFKPEIGCVTHYKHKIEVIDTKAYKARTYPIPDVHKEKVREHLMELEQQGIIKKAATQYINPLVVVIKKNGDIRMCLDARELNKRMANDHDSRLR